MGCLQQKFFSYAGLKDNEKWNSFWAIFLKAYLRQVVILRLLVDCILVDGDVSVSINSVLGVN